MEEEQLNILDILLEKFAIMCYDKDDMIGFVKASELSKKSVKPLLKEIHDNWKKEKTTVID